MFGFINSNIEQNLIENLIKFKIRKNLKNINVHIILFIIHIEYYYSIILYT